METSMFAGYTVVADLQSEVHMVEIIAAETIQDAYRRHVACKPAKQQRTSLQLVKFVKDASIQTLQNFGRRMVALLQFRKTQRIQKEISDAQSKHIDGVNAPEPPQPEHDQVPKLRTYHLRIKELVAREIANVKWNGRNDLFLKLSMQDWCYTTTTKWHADESATWKDLDLQSVFDVTREDLQEQMDWQNSMVSPTIRMQFPKSTQKHDHNLELAVYAYNKNLARSDQLIGVGTLKLDCFEAKRLEAIKKKENQMRTMPKYSNTRFRDPTTGKPVSEASEKMSEVTPQTTPRRLTHTMVSSSTPPRDKSTNLNAFPAHDSLRESHQESYLEYITFTVELFGPSGVRADPNPRSRGYVEIELAFDQISSREKEEIFGAVAVSDEQIADDKESHTQPGNDDSDVLAIETKGESFEGVPDSDAFANSSIESGSQTKACVDDTPLKNLSIENLNMSILSQGASQKGEEAEVTILNEIEALPSPTGMKVKIQSPCEVIHESTDVNTAANDDDRNTPVPDLSREQSRDMRERPPNMMNIHMSASDGRLQTLKSGMKLAVDDGTLASTANSTITGQTSERKSVKGMRRTQSSGRGSINRSDSKLSRKRSSLNGALAIDESLPLFIDELFAKAVQNECGTVTLKSHEVVMVLSALGYSVMLRPDVDATKREVEVSLLNAAQMAACLADFVRSACLLSRGNDKHDAERKQNARSFTFTEKDASTALKNLRKLVEGPWKSTRDFLLRICQNSSLASSKSGGMVRSSSQKLAKSAPKLNTQNSIGRPSQWTSDLVTQLMEVVKLPVKVFDMIDGEGYLKMPNEAVLNEHGLKPSILQARFRLYQFLVRQIELHWDRGNRPQDISEALSMTEKTDKEQQDAWGKLGTLPSTRNSMTIVRTSSMRAERRSGRWTPRDNISTGDREERWGLTNEDIEDFRQTLRVTHAHYESNQLSPRDRPLSPIRSPNNSSPTGITRMHVPVAGSVQNTRIVMQIAPQFHLLQQLIPLNRAYGWGLSMDVLTAYSNITGGRSGYLVDDDLDARLSALGPAGCKWVEIRCNDVKVNKSSKLMRENPTDGTWEVLIPMSCLRLTRSSTLSELSLGRLSDLPIEKITTGMVVYISNDLILSRACERFDWWDRPPAETLYQMSNQKAEIVSTSELEGKRRVGVCVIDQDASVKTGKMSREEFKEEFLRTQQNPNLFTYTSLIDALPIEALTVWDQSKHGKASDNFLDISSGEDIAKDAAFVKGSTNPVNPSAIAPTQSKESKVPSIEISEGIAVPAPTQLLQSPNISPNLDLESPSARGKPAEDAEMRLPRSRSAVNGRPTSAGHRKRPQSASSVANVLESRNMSYRSLPSRDIPTRGQQGVRTGQPTVISMTTTVAPHEVPTRREVLQVAAKYDTLGEAKIQDDIDMFSPPPKHQRNMYRQNSTAKQVLLDERIDQYPQDIEEATGKGSSTVPVGARKEELPSTESTPSVPFSRLQKSRKAKSRVQRSQSPPSPQVPVDGNPLSRSWIQGLAAIMSGPSPPTTQQSSPDGALKVKVHKKKTSMPFENFETGLDEPTSLPMNSPRGSMLSTQMSNGRFRISKEGKEMRPSSASLHNQINPQTEVHRVDLTIPDDAAVDPALTHLTMRAATPSPVRTQRHTSPASRENLRENNSLLHTSLSRSSMGNYDINAMYTDFNDTAIDEPEYDTAMGITSYHKDAESRYVSHQQVFQMDAIAEPVSPSDGREGGLVGRKLNAPGTMAAKQAFHDKLPTGIEKAPYGLLFEPSKEGMDPLSQRNNDAGGGERTRQTKQQEAAYLERKRRPFSAGVNPHVAEERMGARRSMDPVRLRQAKESFDPFADNDARAFEPANGTHFPAFDTDRNDLNLGSPGPADKGQRTVTSSTGRRPLSASATATRKSSRMQSKKARNGETGRANAADSADQNYTNNGHGTRGGKDKPLVKREKLLLDKELRKKQIALEKSLRGLAPEGQRKL